MRWALALVVITTCSTAATELWLPPRLLAESSPVSAVLNEDVFVEVGEEIDLDMTTPLFFHIPRTGGTTIQDLTAFCLDIVAASEVGIFDGHDKDDELQLVSRDNWEATFVNVDTTKIEGIVRASELGFADSGLAEIVFTGFVPQASNALFNENHQASAFSLFRHPVERAISLFYYLQDADWEPTYHKNWKSMTLMDYAENHAEKNWMVRMLVGKYEEELDQNDLNLAKAFVSSRMWVGLTSEMQTSISRFGAIYGWNENPKWDSCVNKFTVNHVSNKHRHPKINQNSAVWKRLLDDNQYDYELYLHAVNTFEEQSVYFEISNGA